MMILAEVINGNLLLGVVPESLALLMFRVSLIVFTVGTRKILDHKDAAAKLESNLEKLAQK